MCVRTNESTRGGGLCQFSQAYGYISLDYNPHTDPPSHKKLKRFRKPVQPFSVSSPNSLQIAIYTFAFSVFPNIRERTTTTLLAHNRTFLDASFKSSCKCRHISKTKSSRVWPQCYYVLSGAVEGFLIHDCQTFPSQTLDRISA